MEALEDRRLLSCTPGGDADDQTCEATTLHPGFFQAGTISTSTDVDMFELKTGLATGISLDFEFDLFSLDGNFDPFLRLFDSNGVQLASNDDGGGFPNSRIVTTLPSTGTYYLGVSAFTNTGYSAEDGTGDTSNSNSTTTGTYLIVASDNNDSIAEALPVLVGQTRTGFANRHTLDVDMFEVVIDGEGSGNLDFTFDLEATASSGLDPHLRLFDASGNELADADNAIFTQRATINHTFASPGTYYLGVSADENENYSAVTGSDDDHGNSTGGYTISVSDNNDEIDEATLSSLNSGSVSGLIDLPTDVDVFRWDGVEGRSIKFEVDGDAGTGGLDTFLRVFDDNGNQLAFDDDGGTGFRDSELTFTFDNTDDFYIGVSSFENQNYDVVDGTGDSATATNTGSYTVTATEVSLDATTALTTRLVWGTCSPMGLDWAATRPASMARLIPVSMWICTGLRSDVTVRLLKLMWICRSQRFPLNRV